MTHIVKTTLPQWPLFALACLMALGVGGILAAYGMMIGSAMGVGSLVVILENL